MIQSDEVGWLGCSSELEGADEPTIFTRWGSFTKIDCVYFYRERIYGFGIRCLEMEDMEMSSVGPEEIGSRRKAEEWQCC